MSVTLGVIALQLAAGYIGSKRQCKLSGDVAAAQQAFEEKATREGIERARDEFNRLCALQREMELQMQKDRIVQIQKSFSSSLDLIAYSETLKNFPLLVPPFVMKNESLPLVPEVPANSTGTGRVSMHCIFTNCTDTQFNVKVFPELEERLSEYFCCYWNIGSGHPILFYQGGWKDTTKDARPFISNLKSELASLPTLVISPVITKEDGLQFFFSCWGMGSEQELQDNSIFIPNGLKFKYQPNYNYSDEDKNFALEELTPSLASLISFFADQYYWNYYNLPPQLPSIILKQKVALNEVQRNDFHRQYSQYMKNYKEKNESLIPEKTILSNLIYLSSLQDYLGKDISKNLLIDILSSEAEINGFQLSGNTELTELIYNANVLENLNIQEIDLINKIVLSI